MTDKVGIFSIDPGGHTGIAWAIVDLTADTAIDAMANRTYSGSDTVEGDELGQAWYIMGLWRNFNQKCRALDRVDIMEDYVIRVGHAPGREALSPVRVGWAFLGILATETTMLTAINVKLRQPSEAMQYNNQNFLRRWDAWIVGRPHERAAFAHLGSWAKDNMK